jgi:hypothetical protein
MSSKAWEKDQQNSRDAFVDLIAPVLEEWNDCEVVNIEGVTEHSVAQKLDEVAGVDAWDIQTEKGIRGVASRAQPKGPFDTFTIRKSRDTGTETEYEKRKRQINNDYLYPHYTVQAYYHQSDWRLQSVAQTRTKDLIKFIENGNEGDRNKWHGDGFGDGDYWTDTGPNATFYAVDWDYLKQSGIGVKVKRPYENPDDVVQPKKQIGLDTYLED